MVVSTKIPPEAAADPDALFKEAKRRERRRRLAVGAIVVVLLAVAGAILVAGSGGKGSGGRGGVSDLSPSGGGKGNQTATSPGDVTTVKLPTTYWFSQVADSGNGLLISGTVPITGRQTWQSAQCVAATVNPRTLRIGPVQRGNCDDPALFAKRVIPVITQHRDGGITVAIATLHNSTRETVSSTVMSYPQVSDGAAVTAYGGGWLWIYDVDTSKGPEVLQVSDTTGQVIRIVPMPQLYRPILAANDEGLWLGNSIEGDVSSTPLWHLSPGATAAVGVGPVGSDLHVYWLVGSGDYLWAGIGTYFDTQTISRFDGPNAQVAFSVPDHGIDPLGVFGNEADGLWTSVPYPPFGVRFSPFDNHRQDIVKINPNSGSETVESTIAPEPNLTAEVGPPEGQGTTLGGAAFILQPPFDANGYLGYKYLVRIP